MRWLGVLWVACVLAVVNSAVKGTVAEIAAIEDTNPIFCNKFAIVRLVSLSTVFWLASIAAKNVFLYASAIAPGRYPHVASPARTVMARASAIMLAARHLCTANLTAAESRSVVRFRASLGSRVSAAIAGLSRSHMCAGRARPSMACQLARVWALSSPLFAASLTARMRRQTSEWTRLGLLLAPAGVGRW